MFYQYYVNSQFKDLINDTTITINTSASGSITTSASIPNGNFGLISAENRPINVITPYEITLNSITFNDNTNAFNTLGLGKLYFKNDGTLRITRTIADYSYNLLVNQPIQILNTFTAYNLYYSNDLPSTFNGDFSLEVILNRRNTSFNSDVVVDLRTDVHFSFRKVNYIIGYSAPGPVSTVQFYTATLMSHDTWQHLVWIRKK